MNTINDSLPNIGLWSSVVKLSRMRILILLSGFRHANRRRKALIILVGIVILAILGFVFYISWSLLRFLQSPEIAELFGEISSLLDSIPTLLLAGAFIGILLTSFGVLLQALYLAGDMDFLLSAPVPIRAVFLTKLLQAILPNFALICLFALPVLFGLGASIGYNWLYFPLAFLVMIALSLTAAGLSSLLVMAVVRIFPARRVAEVLGFIGAIFSFLCSQSGQFAQFGEITPDQATQALSTVSRFDTFWSPLAWAGRGLVAVGQNDWLRGGLYLILVFGLAATIFGLTLNLSERLYYSGWSSMQGKTKKKKAPRQARVTQTSQLAADIATRIPAAMRAILIKDWLVLRRDLRNMSQLITPLIIGVIYAFMFLRNGGPPTPDSTDLPAWANQAMKNFNVYINVGIALFVGWMLLARLAGMGFSQEGKSYWMLKTAPIQVRTLIAAKYLVAYLPTLLLGWVFLLAITLVQRANLTNLFFTIPVVALCIAGNAGLNLSFGITGANFTWEDPRRMQRGGSGCISALASVIYLPVSLGLFFIPAVVLTALGLPEVAGQIIGLAFGGAFSLICAVVPLWLVRNRVPRLSES